MIRLDYLLLVLLRHPPYSPDVLRTSPSVSESPCVSPKLFDSNSNRVPLLCTTGLTDRLLRYCPIHIQRDDNVQMFPVENSQLLFLFSELRGKRCKNRRNYQYLVVLWFPVGVVLGWFISVGAGYHNWVQHGNRIGNHKGWSVLYMDPFRGRSLVITFIRILEARHCLMPFSSHHMTRALWPRLSYPWGFLSVRSRRGIPELGIRRKGSRDIVKRGGSPPPFFRCGVFLFSFDLGVVTRGKGFSLTGFDTVVSL
jgi:hypothetical protein